MHVFNETRQTLLIQQARVADTFWLRLKGLLGSAPLKKQEGLILVGEKSIHTWFMGFPIDVLYVDKDFKVIRADEAMGPYRLGSFISKSAYILEMPIGTIMTTQTTVGDQLKFET